MHWLRPVVMRPGPSLTVSSQGLVAVASSSRCAILYPDGIAESCTTGPRTVWVDGAFVHGLRPVVMHLGFPGLIDSSQTCLQWQALAGAGY